MQQRLSPPTNTLACLRSARCSIRGDGAAFKRAAHQDLNKPSLRRGTVPSSGNIMESTLFAAVPLEGSFEGMDGCGVGIDIEPSSGGFLVTGIAEGGPVSASDLAVGDRIVAVSGVAVARLSKSEVESLLSGPFGSSVQIFTSCASSGVKRTVELHRVFVARVDEDFSAPSNTQPTAHVSAPAAQSPFLAPSSGPSAASRDYPRISFPHADESPPHARGLQVTKAQAKRMMSPRTFEDLKTSSISDVQKLREELSNLRRGRETEDRRFAEQHQIQSNSFTRSSPEQRIGQAKSVPPPAAYSPPPPTVQLQQHSVRQVQQQTRQPSSLSSSYSGSRAGSSTLDLYSFKGGELESLRSQVRQLQHELDESQKLKVLEVEAVKAEMFRELEGLESQHHSELLSLQEQHQQEIGVHQAVNREHEEAFNHARQDMYELMKANADAIASLQSSQEEANATQSVLSQLRIQFGAMEVRSREIASGRDAALAQLEGQAAQIKSLQQQLADLKPSVETLDVECKTLRDQVLAFTRAKDAAERSRDKAIEAAATAEFALGSLQETSHREICALKGALAQAESRTASAAESERLIISLKRELELARSSSISEASYQSILKESRAALDAANETLKVEQAARSAAQGKLAEVPALIQKEIASTEAKVRAAASQATTQMQRDLAIAKADVAALAGSFETRVANEVRLRISEMLLDQNQSRSDEMQFLQNGIHGKSAQLSAMKSEIDRLRAEFDNKLKSSESERLSADARVQQAEARAADLEKFIDKERLLYSEKIRALEATVLQQKSELNDTKRSHDQQDVGSIEQLKSLTRQLQKCQEALVHSAKERHYQDQSIRSKDMRIHELQMELQAATSLQGSVTSSATSAVAFANTSSAQSAYLATLTPSVVASTPNSSSPSETGNLQKSASTQFSSIAPLKQSSSGVDAKMAPALGESRHAAVAGRAVIPPDQDYHPAYQLQQFRQPAPTKNLPEFDSQDSTALQLQIAGVASPISGQVYFQPSSADSTHQSGQQILPGQSPSDSLSRSGATLQEQLAEVQKQLQLLSSRGQAQPVAPQYLPSHVQFSSDTQWGIAARDEAKDDIQFFA